MALDFVVDFGKDFVEMDLEEIVVAWVVGKAVERVAGNSDRDWPEKEE